LQFFTQLKKETICSWKRTARYYDVNVNGEGNDSAAWCYPLPITAAENIAGYVAFWKGIKVRQ